MPLLCAWKGGSITDCYTVLSRRNNNRLVFQTFEKAISENPDATPIFHSDRGFQRTSPMFQAKLNRQGMEQSMSRVGHCIDNGPTEGFWGIIKSEIGSVDLPKVGRAAEAAQSP